MNYQKLKSKFKPAIVAALSSLIILFFISAAHGDDKKSFLNPCNAGTYLVIEGSGTKSLWTFTSDGTLIVTSSAQPLVKFSTQHGSWEKAGLRRAKAALLDFSYDEDNTLLNIARVDILIEFTDRQCQQISGLFSIRFFDNEEDPLDPSTDQGDAITDSFTGERLRPGGLLSTDLP